MKLMIFILIGIFCLSMISSAPSITFQNEKIQPGETILATIENENGNFSEIISSSNIEFFEGRKSVFIESGIFYYNQKHYFFAYPNREGNFTILIKNILYNENGQLKSINIEKKISVKKEASNKTKILSIKPGAIFYEKEPKIKFSNLGNSNLDISLNLELNYENETKTKKFTLSPQESKELYFSPTKNLTLIEITSYKKFIIPIIYSIAQNTTQPKEPLLKFNPELILKNLVAKSKDNATIELFNFGETEIKNIKITSGIKFLKTTELKNMSAKGAENLTVFFSPENQGPFTGNLYINYEQTNETYSISIPLSLFVFQSGSNPTDLKISEKTCNEISGIVCPTTEICEGNSTFTKGGEYCCLGNCKKIEENPSSSTWIYGILIFLVIAVIAYLLYAKSKKTKQKTPDEKLNEISKQYSERVQGKTER